MATYVLIDGLNMFHRAKHVVSGDLDTRVGMSLHITFNALKKAYKDLKGDHVVFCLEGRSWRKNYYEPYKANRAVARLKMSPKEQEEEQIYFEAYTDFTNFFLEKTNATVLQCPVAEADDLIATWIELHPDDDHVIVSSDTDFIQLLAPNVKIYNGINGNTYTHEAVYNEKGKRLAFTVDNGGKIKVGKPDDYFVAEDGWTDYALFLKCIRGDKSDNVFPAYPGARIKGTKNKTGIQEAYADRDNGGFNWNNFMLQRWEDVDGNTRIVKEMYEINRSLIDLRAQPEKYKEQFVDAIVREIVKDRVSNVGVHFLKFCATWDLKRIMQYPDEFANILNAPYKGHLIELHKEEA